MKIKKISLVFLILVIFLSRCIKQQEPADNLMYPIKTEARYKYYGELLEKYGDFARNYINKETISEDDIPKEYLCEPWITMYAQMADAGSEGYGYSFKKLSESDVPVLLLLTKNIYYDGYFINAIYSLVDNKPKLLETYWYRSRCSIGADNFIYVRGSSSATDSTYYRRRIKTDGTDIETLEKIETSFYDGKIHYHYSKYDDEKTEITEQEFGRMISQMPKDNKQSKLEFIPLQ